MIDISKYVDPTDEYTLEVFLFRMLCVIICALVFLFIIAESGNNDDDDNGFGY